MSTRTPRVVIVTRPTPFELMVAHHGTAAQAAFFLATRGGSLEQLRHTHEAQASAVQRVSAAIDVAWRRARVGRDGLDRFLFEDDDIIVAVGQDGLVANTAKYLDGQPVIGINPDPTSHAGELVPHPPAAIDDLLADVVAGRAGRQARTMVEAQIDGGHTLRALNEVFIGHRTHQSARYQVRFDEFTERHSSSGVIVSTGTGCTGWARSVHRERRDQPDLLQPEDPRLLFFVREAFPSPGTGCSLTCGIVDDAVEFVSEMNEGGVVFGDGIEADRIDFGWGKCVRVSRASSALQLVIA